MNSIAKSFYLILLILFSGNEIYAQGCTGTLGMPIKNITFGSGSAQYGSSIPETDYNYLMGTPQDGWYTVVKTTNGMNPGWHQNIINHTPNDPTGYMMVVNASNTPGIFYKSTVDGLCPNTTYEFAAWVINILNTNGNNPNIKFTIQDSNGQIIEEFETNDIPRGSALDWKRYGKTFKMPANAGAITLIMTNKNPGGGGNDLALDDITFSPCGPEIKPEIAGTGRPNTTICEGQSVNVELSATVSSVYLKPSYQWQVNNGSGWTDLNLTGSQTTQVTVPYPNAVAGTYSYQLLVAEAGNINSPNCRIVSSPLTVTVSSNPTPIASFSGSACEGSDVTLTVNTGATFAWTGPNGFTSTLQNPTLTNLLANQSGTYNVLVTNGAGCSSTTTINLQILPKPVVLTNIPNNKATICEETAVQLVASGGTTYRWQPAEGLSNPLIANPIASPTKTTVYTVTATNGTCSDSTSIEIVVSKLAKADAGEDQKALAGQSVNLKGQVSGDNITYLWSPSDYLDDPTKLSPVASPPKDITYTLTVSSDCGTSTDDVFVKIYPKVEIKNTFSPNGDGKNDTWNITALEAFPTHEIKIVNRNGQTVFINKGSYLPWDGKFNQKDVPVGSYYYTIYLNEDFKTLSGWVFVIR